MATTRVLSCFFCLLMLVSMSAISSVETERYERIKNSDEFFYLSSFLEEKGFFVALPELTKTTVLNTNSSDPLVSADADLKVSLVPFLSEDGISARIAYWSGRWEGQRHVGAIAVINQAEIYLYGEAGEVSLVSPEELADTLVIPLYSIQGETPFGLSSVDIYERDVNPVRDSDSYLIMASGCKSVDAWRNGYTILGFLAWSFHHTKTFCYNGSQVSNVVLGDYVSNMDALHYYRGVTSSSDFFYSGNSGHESMKQGHIENCVLKYGCIFSAYPAVKIIAYANGNWTYSTWQ